MIKQEIYEFEIEGLAPLKMDRWTDDPPPKSEEGYKKIAPNKTYKDKKGNVAIPTNALKAAMRFAASEVGKKMEAKKNRQTIKASIFFEDEYLPILPTRKKADEIIRDIVTRGQTDKVTRVATYRPLVVKWKVQGKITAFGVDETFIHNCLELAGFRYGLLAHRPEFGRFIVTKWSKKQ